MALSEEELDELRARAADDPTNPELRLQLVRALIDAGRFREALTTLGDLIGRRRNDRRVGRLLLELQLRWASLGDEEKRLAFRLERRAWAKTVRSPRRASPAAAARFGPVMLGSEARSGSFLLWGPPACGKRSAVAAFVSRKEARLVSLDLLSLVNASGENALHLLEVAFEAALQNRLVVVLLEGLEAISPAEGHGRALGREAWRLRRLLVGRLSRRPGVLVVATTTEPWALDPVIVDSFDERRFWPPPDFGGRMSILGRELEGRARVDDLAEVAKRTDGWSGADLKELCEQAAQQAASRQRVGRRALRAARLATVPTALDWLGRAREHAATSTLDGFYEDMLAYVAHRSSKS